MSGLQTFRSRLGRLKTRRALTRWQTAIARSLVLVVIGLFALLLIDYVLRLEVVPRLFAIMVIVGTVAWWAVRRILPDISKQESVIDIALQLERTHGVDSDLVAALQFDAAAERGVAADSFAATCEPTALAAGSGTLCRKSGTPARQKTAKSGHPTFKNRKLYHYLAAGSGDWRGPAANAVGSSAAPPMTTSLGSATLQRAVIERTAKIAETLDLRSAVPKTDVRRATWLAVIAVVSVSAFCLSFPGHANAFWNRLWLGTVSYPTRTIIHEVAVNGRPDAARVVEGESVEIVVKCSGVTPIDGKVMLRGVETGDSTSVTLQRLDESNDGVVYAADGPPLNEPIELMIQVGDAKTSPRRIAIIRRPLVELTIEAVAPAYMQRDSIRQHEHYIQVMEGSNVNLSLRCTNGKRLAEVRFEPISEGDEPAPPNPIVFTPTDAARTSWHLDTATSALTRIAKDFQFRITVVDEDGLATYHPIEGAVRVKRDRGPTATIATQLHAILPSARPTVAIHAEDDFGIGAIALHARRAEMRDPGAEEEKSVSIRIPVEDTGQAWRDRVVHGEQLLDLSPLRLVEHDKLLVWLEVIDYRGEWSGVSAVSEPITLDVVDERGVLDAILRSDADAEQILTDVIERELGLKGDR
ncbi:MAG: hypothetical protein KDB05_00955 [Planctomycetales bacterium]|nr:hypothetical protein [Planctomycetales bacterium]